jgi:hypothetical protein
MRARTTIGIVLLIAALMPTAAIAANDVSEPHKARPTWDQEVIARETANHALLVNRRYTNSPRGYQRFASHIRHNCVPVYKPGKFVGCEAPYRNGDVGFAGLVWYETGEIGLVTGP